ncbi:hypothetical protein [Pantoea sp. SJZ147]|uniref:hypothetical protein n=1 Tax=Pantoea sp. SJZ147 TaxID=2572896 RepID=UPI0011A1D059|nr:hypothetical protein [Pantoea sp. SJZ147]TWD31566.1 hypothetical protein FBY13_1254 [Pantoea sp. SJZ147]
MEGIFNKVPFITALTFASYITYFSYKAGESLFYGSPISLIQVDFITLIFALLRVSVFLMVLSLVVYIFIVTNSGFWDSTKVSVLALIFVNIVDMVGGKGFNYKTIIVSAAVYVLVFGFCHFTKKIIKCNGSIIDNKMSLSGLLFSWLAISFLTGNYFGPAFQILKDADGNVIISEFKDGFLSMKCNADFSKSFTVIDIKDKKMSNVEKNYLVRNNLIGECNKNLVFK